MDTIKIIITLGISLLLINCDNNKHNTHEESAVKEATTDHEHEGEILIDEHQIEELGIKSELVQIGQFSEVIKVSGEILPAQGAQKLAVAKSSGIINLNKNITEGVSVGKGSNLGNISSAGIVGGDPNTSAKIAYEAAKSEFERVKPLYEAKIVTAKEYQAAEEAYKLAKNSYLGGNAGSSVNSPLTGIVTKLYVENGAFVDAGAPIALISENVELTLKAALPQRYANKLGSIKSANFQLPYSKNIFSTDKMNGRRVTADNASSLNSGYINVAFNFINNGDIIPGTYADVYLLGIEKSNVISIPVSSLTEEMGYTYVYIDEGHGVYEKRQVNTGGVNGVKVEITEGLKAGEKVVTEGAVLVKLASNSSVIPEGHHHH